MKVINKTIKYIEHKLLRAPKVENEILRALRKDILNLINKRNSTMRNN